MATQLKTPEPDTPDGTTIPGEEQPQSPIQRDLEAEAREHGWLPKDEFSAKANADPERWVDAETFMKRADDVMPLLKAQNVRLKRDIDSIKRDLRKATAHFEGAEKRAYERAKAEIEGRIEKATEAGDVAGAKAALEDMGNLKPGDAGTKYTKADFLEAFDSFREDNSWYDMANLASASDLEKRARIYADRFIEKRLAEIPQGEEPPPDEFLAAVTEAVIEKYPALKAPKSRTKPASAVEGGGARGGRGGAKSWDSLPEAARRQYEKFQNRGILGVKTTGDAEKDMAASRAYYAKSHDWEGYSE